jgi:hypothetical protein
MQGSTTICCAPSREIGHGLDATRTRQDDSSLAGRRLSQLMSRRWVACLRMLHHCPTSCSTGASARHMIVDAATRTPAVIAWWIARYAPVARISDRRNSRTTRVLTISPPAIWLKRKCKSTTSSSDDLKAISERERRFGSGCSLGNSGLNQPMRQLHRRTSAGIGNTQER